MFYLGIMMNSFSPGFCIVYYIVLSIQSKSVYTYGSQMHEYDWTEAWFHTREMYLFHSPVSTGTFPSALPGHRTLHIQHGAYLRHKSPGSPPLFLKLWGRVLAVSAGQGRWLHKQVSSNQKENSILRDRQEGKKDEERRERLNTDWPNYR